MKRKDSILTIFALLKSKIVSDLMDQLLIEFVNELPAPWKSRFRLPASA